MHSCPGPEVKPGGGDERTDLPPPPLAGPGFLQCSHRARLGLLFGTSAPVPRDPWAAVDGASGQKSQRGGCPGLLRLYLHSPACSLLQRSPQLPGMCPWPSAPPAPSFMPEGGLGSGPGRLHPGGRSGMDGFSWPHPASVAHRIPAQPSTGTHAFVCAQGHTCTHMPVHRLFCDLTAASFGSGH